ncbi:MAG: hypothetical protein E7454_03935 [Ruminococcaceae bacterium]|nr:hypothetical protein [Oscillospiraceae bacterium]
MVRLFGVLLLLVLLLCGCSQNTATPTDPVGNPSSTATEPITTPGLYVPDSDIEKETAGAVRYFELEGKEYYGCIPLGNNLLLLQQKNGGGLLSLYGGERLELIRTVSMGENVTPTVEQLQLTDQGIGYYDDQSRSVVFLNHQLVEIGRMYLPEEVQGRAYLSPEWKMLYYCTEKGINALDLQTNISRLLKEQYMYKQEVTGVLHNGTLVRCVMQTEQGEEKTVLLDSASGLVAYEGAYLQKLETKENSYFLPRDLGGVGQLQFGNAEHQQVLWPEGGSNKPYWLHTDHAVVTVAEGEASCLEYYDLESGKRQAMLEIKDATAVLSVQGDGKGGVWLLCRTEENEKLYHWNAKKNTLNDETVYTEPMYTAESPNEEALAELKLQADELGKKFGVDILIWKDAISAAPEDYVFSEEYLVQAYQLYLPWLEKLMSGFPDGFFEKTPDGNLKIALVQKISGDPEWGTLPDSPCIQYWKGDTPVLALTTDQSFEQNFYHAVAHFIDWRVLSKTSVFYEWNTLNPSGFTYDNSYIENLERTDTTHIEGDNRYFIDLFSMSYAKEDRARIMEYACTSGNEEYFRAPVIQEKLRRICEGIRAAFGLKKVETEFIWEQYLQKK